MNEMRVARGLGWFSLGLGLAEVVAGRHIGRALGMEDKSWLLRAFGVREMAAGVMILGSEQPRAGVWARVAGDALDLAALGSGFTEDNPKKENLAAAIVTVAGITALDYWCARRLHSGRPHGSLRTHRENVADGSNPHYRDSPEVAPGK
ncbi:cyclase dehydrase [Singulisphaera sp. PoT]|uniref:cyclase dehydrase n=1 Tax=Singulisphaera sp. PoT TaxID=3411797 RepID=UPI003BF4B125